MTRPPDASSGTSTPSVSYDTVNGVPARGGSLDGPGPVIGEGLLFVNSGYTVDGGIAGNVVLAFRWTAR